MSSKYFQLFIKYFLDMKVDYPAMYSDTEPMFNCYQVSTMDWTK